MIKKLLISLFIVSAMGITSVVTTHALLSDQAVLSANTFSTGTPDLLVCSGKTCTDYQDDHAGFSENILPGETKTEFFRLKNNSSNVDFSIAAQTASLSGGINSDDVSITITPVDSSYNQIVGSTPVTKTLSEWQTPTDLGIPTVNAGSLQRYKMDVTLSASVTVGGANTTFNFVFTGTQTP